MSVSEVKRLRELDRENACLKRLLAERTLLQGATNFIEGFGYFLLSQYYG